jgi:sugar O-acyltransferase (sialic acid O-acetyltransferase NeuD family)
MHELVIVGAGGFAREIRELAPHCFASGSIRIKGFLSSNPRDFDNYQVDEPILDDPEHYAPTENDQFVLAVGDVQLRKRLSAALKARGAKFVSLIHPTALVARTAQLGEGCVLYPYSVVMNAARLDDFVLLNLHASAGHDTQIGKYCNLCPYATINGFSTLEPEVFMGTHSCVLPGRRVGSGSKISAGSVAAHDVGPRTLVYGVPGKHLPLTQT